MQEMHQPVTIQVSAPTVITLLMDGQITALIIQGSLIVDPAILQMLQPIIMQGSAHNVTPLVAGLVVGLTMPVKQIAYLAIQAIPQPIITLDNARIVTTLPLGG